MPAGKIFSFICKKILRLITLLTALCIISFYLVSNSPIDPIQAYVGADMTRVGAEQREKIAEHWGLNRTPAVQFINWAREMLRGNLGTSIIYRRPVSEVIGERFLYSIILMAISWLISGILGFLMGIAAAMKRDTWIDRIIKGYCFTLASTPTFWLGLLLLIVFSMKLGWFPIGLGVPAGVLSEDVTILNRLKHLILPALTLSIIGVSNVALHTRQKLVDVLYSDYVLFARARGEEGFTLLLRHGVRNISLPAITLQFASFGELFGGAVLAEQVFSYPGLGNVTVQAGLRGDVPLLLGIVIFSAIFVFTGNLVSDLVYNIVDPRIRKGELYE